MPESGVLLHHRENGSARVEGLATTFRLLAKTENDAAIRAWSRAGLPLSCHSRWGPGGALKRRNPVCGREILRRVPTMSPEWKAIIRQNQGRLSGELRDAVVGSDSQVFRNGCQAAIWFREYDLIPTLLTVLQDTKSPHADLAGETVLELLEYLYEELAGTRPERSSRSAIDPPLSGDRLGAGRTKSMGNIGDRRSSRRSSCWCVATTSR